LLEHLLPNIQKVLSRYPNLFLSGLKYTLILSLITVFFGVLLGSLIALMRRARFKPIALLATAYVEVIRGTPLLLQLYFFAFLLPEMLPILELSNFTCICVALVLNSAGYVSEVIRAGIQAVDYGQTEAARSLGMTAHQTMLRVVFPQAVKNILPALCNEFVTVIKETSLASTFFIGDLMTSYNVIKGAMYLVLEPLIVVGVIYFVLTFTLSKAIAVLERRLKESD
jgi:His/Glu/Gln/Arg/opine family amino acid ABC transporter permease subunit